MSSTRSILVVDDEMELANLFRVYLNRSGYYSISFTDPLLAYEHINQNPQKYSVIITDLRMPQMNGITLAKNVRKINSRIKIFLITAFATEDLANNNKDLENINFSGIIQKPVRMKEITQRISQELAA